MARHSETPMYIPAQAKRRFLSQFSTLFLRTARRLVFLGRASRADGFPPKLGDPQEWPVLVLPLVQPKTNPKR